MLSTSHTIISLPFGLLGMNPVTTFFTAFIVHFFLDMALHWNIYPQQFKKYPFFLVGIDVASGFIAAYFLLEGSMFTLPVLAAIAGGNTPDVLHALWTFLGKKRQKRTPQFIQAAFHFHESIQWETESPLKGGLSQVLFGLIAVFLTLALR